MKSLVFLLVLFVFVNVSQAAEKSKKCNLTCSSGKVLDQVDCKCVCDPSIDCTKVNLLFIKNSKTCDCECPKVSCRSNQHVNNKTCSCACNEYCLGCKSPQKWSDFDCQCQCPNEKLLKCKSYQYFDHETCACKCKETPAGCCQPHAWDKSSCACKCPNVVTCPVGKVWNNDECQCKCSKVATCKSPFVWREETCSCGCPDVACIQNYIVNSTTCKCQCDQSLSRSCKTGVTKWDSTSCSCQCIETENTPSCIDGTVLDPDTCNACIYLQTKACTAPQVWDKLLGICDCGQTLECEISNDSGMHFWNPNKCACDCINSDTNCPVDTVFDYASCSCLCNITSKSCPTGESFNPVSCLCDANNPYANYIDG